MRHFCSIQQTGVERYVVVLRREVDGTPWPSRWESREYRSLDAARAHYAATVECHALLDRLRLSLRGNGPGVVSLLDRERRHLLSGWVEVRGGE